MDVGEAELQLANLRLCESALGGAHAPEATLQIEQLLLDACDLLRRRLGDAIDERVDGGGGRPLAGHHQRGLAGEGREQHAAGRIAIACHGIEAKRGDGRRGDGTFSRSGIPEQPEHLLLAAAMAVPIDDGGNGVRLLR